MPMSETYERIGTPVGDIAVIFGKGGPDILEVADWADTIPYEIMTGLGRRVSRVHM